MHQLCRVAVAAAMTAPFLLLAPSTASAAPCVPHVNSKGPTVYVYPNYSDPTKTDYEYDSEGTYVEVDLCLEG